MIRRFLSLLMSLTLVFSTLLQFHHHDRMGNIFLTLSFVGEVELGFHHHHHSECCHHHHRGTAPDDCGDNGGCSMHLDETVVTPDDDPDGDIVATAVDDFTALTRQTVSVPPTGNCRNRFLRHTCALTARKHIKHVTRRGPPQQHIEPSFHKTITLNSNESIC